MPNDRQQTFGDIVPNNDDWIECSDGTVRVRSDCYFDVAGSAHGSEVDARDANRQLFKKTLCDINQWCIDYTSGVHNTDYGDGYAYIASEACERWPNCIGEWLSDHWFNEYGRELDDNLRDKLIKLICDEIDDWDSEYSYNEYADYSGSGCCLYSLEVGEYEEQVDISGHDTFVKLDEIGALEDCCDWMDNTDREFCIYNHDRYDESSGRRVRGDYVRSACFTFYPHCGGQWHYVVPADKMRQHVANAIIELARKK